jgi:uncharacterized protein
MSGRPVIDSLEFARLGSTLKGAVQLAELPRLHDELADRAGAIGYELTGYKGPHAEPALRLKLSGRLMLRCQRCLQALEHTVASRREFLLVRPGDPEPDIGEEGETIDHVPADPKLDVVGLVEEELVLSLPMAPMHAAGQCEPARPAEEMVRQNSPFSALAALKRDPKS